MSHPLFDRHNLAGLYIPNRVVMAPMTRCRITQPGDIPNDLMAEYYAQRASAGLIITEATQISKQGQGYSFTPGIYSNDQIDGWKKVTRRVHDAGGRIFLQLWHVGRMSHESFHPDGKPVAPSALSPDAQVWVADPETGQGGMVDCPVPRAMTIEDIKAAIEDYRQGAANAIAAGFDGVEIHGANGYLIDEFLRSSSNHRDDAYGGSQKNRIRFLVEVCEAIAGEIGADRVGIRLSPYVTQRNMVDPEIVDTMLLATREINRIGLAYIHLGEADWDDAPQIPEQFRKDLRKIYDGTIIVAGKYTKERAQNVLDAGYADLVAFGRPFIANPDLVARFQRDLALDDLDAATLFGGDGHGYTDYQTTAA